jgi:diadenosine tetraphosphate (Ap4A) HIT family hydrolase
MELYKGKYWEVIFGDWCQEFVGYCIISCHKEKISDLNEDEWQELGMIEKELERVCKKLFKATMFNFACLMNNAYRDNEKPHVHFHFVPRYKEKTTILGKQYKDKHFGYNFWKWALNKHKSQKDIFNKEEKQTIFTMMKNELSLTAHDSCKNQVFSSSKNGYSKELFYDRIDLIFTNETSRDVFKRQIDSYYSLKETSIPKHHYEIGENVKLSKGMFMRGEGALAELSDDKLEFISKNGFITPDVTTEYNPKQKTPLCIPVWIIQKDMPLSEYINMYSGSTFVYTKKEDGYKEHTFLVPYKKQEEAIEKMRKETFWMWRCEQTKENRFMPSLARDDINVQIAFIMNTKKSDDLIKNDIFNLDFNKKVLEDFIQPFFINDFIYGERNDLTTNREGAIIFGIPPCMIEGILVGRLYEKDAKKLDKIKHFFPDCYICNLDGKVIR